MNESLTSQDVQNVVIGTAGHIDHGKSSLIRRLTGMDPDRLKEEKERAMTIDLGFANFQLSTGQRVGFIDVPGHERFVKNMVAGADGVDVGLLVVAADDGVMPQTREHLEIMDLLGVQKGLIAVTKIDMVDAELAELAVAEVTEFVEGTFLEGAPAIPVSSETGEGFDELREVLEDVVGTVKPKETSGVFRMPIQRVFSVKGFGTVVTGVPKSGRISVGDEVEIVPQKFTGRVRGIQAYSRDLDVARAGHSTALNLADVDYKKVHRGNVVATPGYFEGSRLIEVRLRYTGFERRPLESYSTVRFHVGTSEKLGTLVLLDAATLLPEEEGLAQIRLREPIVVAPDDRFIIRLHSPMVTIGGGIILGTSEYRLKPFKEFVLEHLHEKEEALGDEVDYLEATLATSEQTPLSRTELQKATKLLPEKLNQDLERLLDREQIFPLPRGDRFVHRKGLEQAAADIENRLQTYLKKAPLEQSVPRAEIKSQSGLDGDLFDLAVGRLAEQGTIDDPRGKRLRPTDWEPVLNKRQQDWYEKLRQLAVEQGNQPPTISEAAEQFGADGREVTELEKLARLHEARGTLVLLEDLCFDPDVVEEAISVMKRLLDDHPEGVSASRFRDALNTTRKYAIPLLEHLDERGVTTMRDGLRFPAPME